MPKLDTLTVNGSSDVPVLSIEVGKHSKLDALRLELWQQPATGSNWFRRFPNLRTLELDQCTLASWSDLFVPATQLKELRNLSLAYVDATDSKEYLSDYLDRLTFMSLQQCEMSKSLLTELISLCPKLEEIHLLEMEIVDDDILMEICQKLTQLATLHVTKCQYVTDVTVNNILEFCPNIGKVSLGCCKNISEEAVERLKTVKTIQVSYEAFVEEKVEELDKSTQC